MESEPLKIFVSFFWLALFFGSVWLSSLGEPGFEGLAGAEPVLLRWESGVREWAAVNGHRSKIAAIWK